MPYRDSIEALQERYDSLLRELAARREETRTLDALRDEEGRVEGELRDVATKLGDLRKKSARLPLLENVAIASPCTADWNKMSGDARVRFCGDCKKNVYNLSEMSAVDAERLLADRVGSEVCVRLYRRADGTVLTQDCAVGVKKRRRRKIAFGVAGGAMLAASAAAAASLHLQSRTTMGAIRPSSQTTMGQAVDMGAFVEMGESTQQIAAPPSPPHSAPAPSQTARPLHTGYEHEQRDGFSQGQVVRIIR